MQPNLSSQLVTLACRNSLDIVAASYQHAPHSSRAVLLTHGMFSSQTSGTIQAITPILWNLANSTLIIDLYAHGKSSGELQSMTASKIIESVTTGIDFLISKGHKKITLFGSSMSGFACIEAANLYPEFVEKVILKSPVVDYQDLYRRRLGEEGLAKWKTEGSLKLFDHRIDDTVDIPFTFFQSFQDYPFAAQLLPEDRPVHIVHGTNDEVVPIEHVEYSIPLKAQTWSIRRIQEANHEYMNREHRKELYEVLTQMFSDI